MQTKLATAALVATVLAGGTAIAAAQGGSTDRNGNAMGSQNVGNGAAPGSAMKGTTGINNSQSARDNPNGSPGGAPKAHAGPQGDPSKKEDAPK
jgi:hypothetical protein